MKLRGCDVYRDRALAGATVGAQFQQSVTYIYTLEYSVCNDIESGFAQCGSQRMRYQPAGLCGSSVPIATWWGVGSVPFLMNTLP